MLIVLFKIIAGVIVCGILLLFVLIEFIHEYCKKHVDNIKDE